MQADPQGAARAGEPAGRSMLPTVLSALVASVVAVFFIFTLLYPLGYALVEAIREPVTEMPRADESWIELAARAGVSEEALQKLNNSPAGQTHPAAGKPVVIARSFTLRHLARVFDSDAPQWRWIVNSLLLATVVTFMCAAISYPLAWLQARA